MPQQKNSPRSMGMYLAAMTIFGTIGLFRRLIPLPSALVAFFRGVIGAAFLIAFVRLRGGTLRHGLSRRVTARLALTGAIIGVNWMLLFEAYNYTSVSIATLCYYMQPTFVVLFSALVLRERLGLRKGLCALTALVGMVLVSGIPESGLPQARDLTGILLGLGAGACYAVVVLLNKSVQGADAYEKTVIQLSAAALVLLPYLLLTGSFAASSWSWRTVGLLLLVGILHTGLSYTLYFGAMDGLRTQTVALLSYLDPVVALFLSAALLHEALSVLAAFGAVLILGSAAVCELGDAWTPRGKKGTL